MAGYSKDEGDLSRALPARVKHKSQLQWNDVSSTSSMSAGKGSSSHVYGNVTIHDQARVHLGNQHIQNVHVSVRTLHKRLGQQQRASRKRSTDSHGGRDFQSARTSLSNRLQLAKQNSIIEHPLRLDVSDSIIFTDCLGRNFKLPVAYFSYWQTFAGFLKDNFRKGEIAGAQHVDSGAYMLTKAGAGTILLEEHNWKSFATAGSKIFMDIVLVNTRLALQKCPRPSCQALLIQVFTEGEAITCAKCGLIYAYDPTRPLPVSVDEDTRVGKLQSFEDLQRFGLRRSPEDLSEIQSEDEVIAGPGSDSDSHSASTDTDKPSEGVDLPESPEAEAGMNHSGMPRLSSPNHEDDNPFEYDLGSNQGPMENDSENAVEAWLSKNVMPSGETETAHHDEHSKKQASFAREQDDLNALKRVVFTSIEPPTKPLRQVVEGFDKLSGEEQTYTLRTMDKFPSLPAEIAKRLAKANAVRRHRLAGLQPEPRDWEWSTF